MTNRRGRPLTSQAIGVLLRNQLYAGIVDVRKYGVRGKRGDSEPLISQDFQSHTFAESATLFELAPGVASWNRLVLWMQQLESLSRVS